MSQGNSGGPNLENFFMAAAGVIVGFAAVVWFTGGLAGFLFGGGWPSASVGEAPLTLVRLFAHLGNPAAAWPAPAGRQVPGAFAFYFTFVALVAFFGGGGYYLFRRVRELVTGNGRGALGQENSSWARRGSLKALHVNSAEKGRMVLGKASGQLIATEPRQSVIVMGPTQSGKTTGLAVPAILEWEGPVIATSVKNDLSRDTMSWRERQGEVWVYDPTESTSLPASTWSPLDGARDWQGAKRIASWLVGASQGGDGKSGLNDAQFWYTAAGKLLAPHLFAAAANGYTMADVVRWIDTQEDFELRALLQAAGVPEAIVAAEASWNREERARSSIYTTAEVVIEAYSDPTVLDSARTSDIRASKFLDGGNHTLYVCAPGHEQDRLRPVFSTILKQFITAAYEKSLANGGVPMDPPLLIVLDEAANIAPLKDLDAIASTAAGHGIQLMTVWQDLAQINARYGDRAQTVVNNHRAKVVLSGISDTSTLDYVSRLIGSEDVRQLSKTRDGQGSQSTTESRADKNLAPSDVLRRIRQNEGVLIYGALLPSRLLLRPWYKIKELKQKAEATPIGSRVRASAVNGSNSNNANSGSNDGGGNSGAGMDAAYREILGDGFEDDTLNTPFPGGASGANAAGANTSGARRWDPTAKPSYDPYAPPAARMGDLPADPYAQPANGLGAYTFDPDNDPFADLFADLPALPEDVDGLYGPGAAQDVRAASPFDEPTSFNTDVAPRAASQRYGASSPPPMTSPPMTPPPLNSSGNAAPPPPPPPPRSRSQSRSQSRRAPAARNDAPGARAWGALGKKTPFPPPGDDSSPAGQSGEDAPTSGNSDAGSDVAGSSDTETFKPNTADLFGLSGSGDLENLDSLDRLDESDSESEDSER